VNILGFGLLGCDTM